MIFKLLAEEEAKDAIDRVSQRDLGRGSSTYSLNLAVHAKSCIVPCHGSNTRLRYIAT